MTDVGELLEAFEKWLRGKRGLQHKQGAGKRRKAIMDTMSHFLPPLARKDPSLTKDLLRLMEVCRQEAQALRADRKEHVDFFIDFLDERTSTAEDLLAPEVTSAAPESVAASSLVAEDQSSSITRVAVATVPQRRIIGRVSVTEDSPSKPTEFEFWAEDRDDLHLEVGSVVTATGQTDEGQVHIIGIVMDLRATSATGSPLDDFYATGYGDPTVTVPTRRPVIRLAKVNVVYRSDGRFEPPTGSWAVHFATDEEIMRAYGADIPEERRVLAGFVWNEAKRPVPIYLDARYLLGYEGAHLNISGASGLATKTSYALFLLQSIMTYCREEEEPVAVVAFNVKEADLMRIDGGPADWQSLEGRLDLEKRQLDLWRASRDEGLDPFAFRQHVTFYAPPRPDDPRRPLTFRAGEASTVLYSYGLMDIVDAGGVAMMGLLDFEDIDEKTSGLLYSIVDAIRDPRDQTLVPKPGNFNDLLSRLGQTLAGRRDWIDIGFGTHHSATVSKVLNRLSQAVLHQLRGVVLLHDGRGRPVPIERLRPGQVWVVDIAKLHPKGQRLVFTNIYQALDRILEAKRNREDTVQIADRTLNIGDFPDRVVVFVDELNKFAPQGREAAPLKTHIVNITARGRSIGLSLIGAEQVANQVDEELMANTSTYAVGRSHAISLKGALFDWLQAGLREKAMLLSKGDMILWHAIHSRPALISFPKPIHMIGEE